MENPFDDIISASVLKTYEAIREDLKTEIREALKKEAGEKLLSPVETCKLFNPQISRVTLQSWTTAGHLTRYELGGRVYYRYSEVIEATKTLKRYKKA